MPKTFFTSDPHLGHDFVARDRGHATTAEHDAAFADAWRAVVGPRDTVWVLGDVCLGNYAAKADPILSVLPGVKHLVLGNHDVGHPLHRGWLNKRQAYFPTFASVHTDATVRIAGHKVRLNHFPYSGEHAAADGSHTEDRHPEWRPVDVGGWLIHGHVHGEWQVRGRQINVGIDVWDGPVPEDRLEQIIRGEDTT